MKVKVIGRYHYSNFGNCLFFHPKVLKEFLRSLEELLKVLQEFLRLLKTS